MERSGRSIGKEGSSGRVLRIRTQPFNILIRKDNSHAFFFCYSALESVTNIK